MTDRYLGETPWEARGREIDDEQRRQQQRADRCEDHAPAPAPVTDYQPASPGEAWA